MALKLPVYVTAQWLHHQAPCKTTVMRLMGIAKQPLSNVTFTFNSRRNNTTSTHRNEQYRSRLSVTVSENSAKRQYTALSSLIGAAALIVGFISYFRKHSNHNISSVLNVPLSSVSASAIYDSILPPSKRFNFIADVVEKAAPAVVYIEIRDRLLFSSRMLPMANGSGFVVRADGLIITNAHVVGNKSTVNIRFYDGKQMEGTVVAVDPVSDLAAIKVNATGLTVLKMGQSSSLRAGEWVIAMGSPLSLSNTVTCGIISSVQRHSKDLGLRHKDMDYIQTDALITFGNSGGPLVNLDGEVIGINTMKVTPGISFAIPSDYASNFLSKVDDVFKSGQPKKRQWFGMGSDASRRRFIGITMLTLNPELVMELKTRVPDFPDINGGVLVHKIVVGSPAFRGGLRAGDIIVEISGKPILSSTDVYSLVESSKSLEITAYRGNKKISCVIVPEEVN